MGVLDDAIREHLELKRRHGADPGEVAREERDALGPVRREPEAAPSASADTAPESIGPDEDEDDELFEAPTTISPPQSPVPYDDEEDEPGAGQPTTEYDYEGELARDRPGGAGAPDPADEDTWLQDEPHETAEADRAPASGERRGPEGHEGEPEDSAEDVLEETPEFLQETPEHDRLWFEQRPPRDFDFDK